MSYKLLVSGSYNCFKESVLGSFVGIYMVSGLYNTESVINPIYIGSSIDIRQRICYEHIPDLNSGIHPNPILQSAWNKYGENNFIWFALEECNAQDQLFREQYYLDLYRPFIDEQRGFNIAKSAIAPFLGRKHTKESRKLMSIALKGKVRSDETKDRIRKSKIGKKIPNWKLSEKGLAKLIERNKSIEQRNKNSGVNNNRYGKPRPKGAGKQPANYKLLSPTGEIIVGDNISKLCRDNNLRQGLISMVINGKRKHHKGWSLI